VEDVQFITNNAVCRVDFTDGVQKARIYYAKNLFMKGKSPRWWIDPTPMGRNITSLPRKLKKAIKQFYPVLLIAGDDDVQRSE
jgi:alpha-beta hydrolase superfamily lysophospholipase